jgi:hypothetical protein
MMQMWSSGQVIGMIQDISTRAALLSHIEKEALKAMRRVQSSFIYAPDSRL